MLQQLDSGSPEAEHVSRCARCQRRRLEVTLDATLDSQKTLQRSGPPDDSLADGVAVGPYVVARRLGAGAMGAVYAAWDPRLEREVALKVLHLGGDLLAEARLLAKLSHPNVVTVHEVLEWRGRAVLVMELARGLSLRQWLAKEPRRTAAILEVFTQCARGLQAAHAAGIIHRDFKPDNVLVDDTGRARLLDFGLAMPSVSATGGLAGSPAYMGLAQLRHAPADAASDQFSWWASLYEALSGKLPHDADSLEALLAAREHPVDLARVPRWLRKPMARGLSNVAAARFASMDEAVRVLRQRRSAGWVAASVALALAVTLGVWARAPASPCGGLTFTAQALRARTSEPALLETIAEYEREAAACRALTADAQPARAACLEQSGQELDVALAALEGSPVEPSLRPRVLRRVVPPSRCARAPTPTVAHLDAGGRAALVDSLRASLHFDALRTAGDAEGALAFAQRRSSEVGDASAAARAWAGLDEASALSGVGRAVDALKLLRKLEAVSGLGPRERAWLALGRWLFECYSSAEEHCVVAQRQARRASAELDEPWARAFEKEISAWAERDVGAREVIETWRRIPGATFEVSRAVVNELTGALTDDSLSRLREARRLAASVAQPDARLTLRMLEVDLYFAGLAGDLAQARKLMAQLDALPEGPLVVRARYEGHVRLLSFAARHQELLDYLERTPPPPGQSKKTVVLARVHALQKVGSPLLAEALKQATLLEDTLSVEELDFLEGERIRQALAVGDAAALARLAVFPGDELQREWQLAELRGDGVAERAVFERARREQGPAAQRLVLEALAREGQHERVVAEAPRLREQSPSRMLELQLRLLEAWSLDALGRRDEACRVMNLAVLSTWLTPRESARADELLRRCPRVGLSGWEDPPAAK